MANIAQMVAVSVQKVLTLETEGCTKHVTGRRK